MSESRDDEWNKKYLSLRAYVEANHQLPDKKTIENRGLLNWWKYNKKVFKQGRLAPWKLEKLKALSNMRLVHKNIWDK